MSEVEHLKKAVRTILETFERDEAQGYRSRDRQYAIDMLKPFRAILAETAPTSKGGDSDTSATRHDSGLGHSRADIAQPARDEMPAPARWHAVFQTGDTLGIRPRPYPTREACTLAQQSSPHFLGAVETSWFRPLNPPDVVAELVRALREARGDLDAINQGKANEPWNMRGIGLLNGAIAIIDTALTAACAAGYGGG